MSRNLCNDWIKRCDNLLKENFTKFHKCAELQETLRLKFIETNTEYKFFKTWLHTAFEDTIMLKREHSDLSRLYQVLLKSNLNKEFIDYFTNKETMQLKYMETVNQCMNLKICLEVANKDIQSMKSENEELSHRYGAFLQNVFVDELFDVYTHQQEAMLLKFVETADKCENLNASLNKAYEAIIRLISEHDGIVKSYQELSAISIVKEFLEYSKYQETIRLKFAEKPNDSKENYGEVRESIEQSVNNNILPSDYSNTGAESGTESKDGILDINNKISYLDEANNESIVVKRETLEIAAVFLEAPTNETLELSSSPFDCDGLYVENSDTSALPSEADRKYNLSVQAGPPSTRELNGGIQQLHTTIKISNLTRILPHPKRKSVLYGKPSLKIINPIGNAHDLVETESMLCDKCGKSFDNKKHKQCPICNIVRSNRRGRKPKMFSTASNVNITNGLDSRCDICLRNYSSKSSLKKHISAIHDKQKPYKCSECDKTFSAKCNLKTHVIVHSSEKPFQCSSCDECFRDPSSKRRHEQSFHGKARFCCAVCDQRFFRKDKLLRHIQKEHLSNRNSTKKFKCTICAKLLSSKQILKRHYCRVHKSEASRMILSKSVDFHCAHCEKRYVKKSHLAKHLQKHSFVIDPSSFDEYDEEILQMRSIEVRRNSKKTPM